MVPTIRNEQRMGYFSRLLYARTSFTYTGQHPAHKGKEIFSSSTSARPHPYRISTVTVCKTYVIRSAEEEEEEEEINTITLRGTLMSQVHTLPAACV